MIKNQRLIFRWQEQQQLMGLQLVVKTESWILNKWSSSLYHFSVCFFLERISLFWFGRKLCYKRQKQVNLIRKKNLYMKSEWLNAMRTSNGTLKSLWMHLKWSLNSTLLLLMCLFNDQTCFCPKFQRLRRKSKKAEQNKHNK